MAAHDTAPPDAGRNPARGLALACHPGPTVVVTALSLGLVLGIGARAPLAALVGAAVLAGQLSIGWSNDWFDAARDRAVGRSDKPVVAGLVDVGLLRRAALMAAALCIVLSLGTGRAAGVVHLLAVAGGWLYNGLLKRTVLSWLPYAVSFGLLPAFIVLALPGGARPAGWALATGALLGAGAHVANVLPDLEDDARTGVRGLPHRLGRRACGVLAPSLLMAGVAVVALGSGRSTGAAAIAAGLAGVLALAAGAVGLARPTSRLPFSLSMAVAAICVGLLVASGPALAVR